MYIYIYIYNVDTYIYLHLLVNALMSYLNSLHARSAAYTGYVDLLITECTCT